MRFGVWGLRLACPRAFAPSQLAPILRGLSKTFKPLVIFYFFRSSDKGAVPLHSNHKPHTPHLTSKIRSKLIPNIPPKIHPVIMQLPQCLARLLGRIIYCGAVRSDTKYPSAIGHHFTLFGAGAGMK